MLKATENIFFWSPDQQFCLHQVSSYLLFWLPKILETSSPAPYLHLLFLCPMHQPPSPLTSIHLRADFRRDFPKWRGEFDTLGLSSLHPASPSSSSCFPPDRTQRTPHLFIVCSPLSLLLKALNGPLVWKGRQWSSFNAIIYNRKEGFKKRKQERQF